MTSIDPRDVRRSVSESVARLDDQESEVAEALLSEIENPEK